MLMGFKYDLPLPWTKSHTNLPRKCVTRNIQSDAIQQCRPWRPPSTVATSHWPNGKYMTWTPKHLRWRSSMMRSVPFNQVKPRLPVGNPHTTPSASFVPPARARLAPRDRARAVATLCLQFRRRDSRHFELLHSQFGVVSLPGASAISFPAPHFGGFFPARVVKVS